MHSCMFLSRPSLRERETDRETHTHRERERERERDLGLPCPPHAALCSHETLWVMSAREGELEEEEDTHTHLEDVTACFKEGGRVLL